MKKVYQFFNYIIPILLIIGTNSVIADPDDYVTNNFMYWNWDRIPTREDPMLFALDWIRVSEALMTDDE